MNPLKLTLEGYRSYLHEATLEWSEGCTAIVGVNGAGKTSLVRAVESALFGGRDLARSVTRGSAGMRLVLEYEHNGGGFRIERRVHHGKALCEWSTRILHPDAAGYDAAEWRTLTKETVAETDTAIREHLGITRETFRASAYLAQGDGAAFTEARPAERKAILSEILALHRWDELGEAAKQRREAAQADARSAHEQAERVRGHAEERGYHEQELIAAERENATAAEQAAAAAAVAAAAIREAAAAVAAQEAAQTAAAEQARMAREVESAERRHAAADVALRAAQRQAEELPGYLTKTERIPHLEAEAAAQRARHEAARELEHEYAQVQREMQADGKLHDENEARARRLRMQAEQPHGTCELCHQPLTSEAARSHLLDEATISEDACEHIAARQRGRWKRLEELTQQLQQHRLPGEDWETQLREARSAIPMVERLRVQAEAVPQHEEQVRRAAADLESAQLAHYAAVERAASLQRTAAGTAELIRAEQEASRAAAAAQQAVQRTRERIVLCEAALNGVREAERELRAATEALARHEHDAVIWSYLVRAYGRDGIPALIVENAVPDITNAANRILEELGTALRVELRTQKALKSSARIADTLDVVVTTPTGEALYEDFSGGERTRLNIALRLGLARLLAQRRGADVRLLVLDEPEFLDEDGLDRLIVVLRGLQDTFSRIVLISHQPALRDSFDHVVEVTNDPEHGSGIVPDVVEAVA